jgi:hypothetical protein
MANLTVGLDLAQKRDFSALAITERVEVWKGEQGWNLWGDRVDFYENRFEVRHLHRFPLRTPYPEIVDAVCELMNSSPQMQEEAVLVIDSTGVGQAVVDMFSEAYQDDRLGSNWPVPITITGGEKQHAYNVPKSHLISTLDVLLDTGRLLIADELRYADVLRKELLDFSVRKTPKGGEAFGTWRDSEHDDLVLAVALSVWFEHRRGVPRLIELAPRTEIQLEMKDWYPIDLWSR